MRTNPNKDGTKRHAMSMITVSADAQPFDVAHAQAIRGEEVRRDPAA